MLFIDYYFTYKNTIRFLLLNRSGNILNIYNIPNIKKLIFYFSFKKLEDKDEIQILNSFYLLKFFLGQNAFFTKNKSFFLLGKWYYNFSIKSIINTNKDIYYLLYFFFNNVLSKIDKTLLKSGYYSKNLNIYYYIIKDMNLFSEIKTNIGLFNLKTNLKLNILLSGIDNNDAVFLSNCFKIK